MSPWTSHSRVCKLSPSRLELPVAEPRVCMVGSAMVDLVARVPRLPSAGETLVGSEFSIGFGGKGSNQAVMAARLGAGVSVVVRLGRDPFGEESLQNYREQGIDTSFVRFDDSRSSGVAPITVDEETGQNIVIIVPGANDGLSPEDVREAGAALLRADVVMCQLETPLEATLEAFHTVKTRGDTLAILNPAPAADMPDELLRLTDVFVPNEVEAAMLLGGSVETVEDAEEAARALLGRGPKRVVITLGERGAVFVEGNGAPQRVAAEQVKAVDSTGAGDAFVGALAYLLGKGSGLEGAVTRAAAIATVSVQRAGTQSSYPYREEVEHLL